MAQRVKVIAEAGVNHDGDEQLAHELIDIAFEAGADAVKFQTFDPEALTSAHADSTPYQRERDGSADQRSMLRRLMLPAGSWERLRDHCDKAGIEFLSTPFDLASARMLVDLGVGALKLSSGELTNTPFLAEVADMGVPLLVSTGMGDAAEVADAVAACAGAPALTLLHCVSAYPAPVEHANLRAIPGMAAAHGCPVGWSDHTLGMTTAIAAVALGATVLEKHFSSDPTRPGPDHAASLDPAALAEYVRAARDCAASLGDGVKRQMPSEAENAPLVRRSWHATRDVKAGEVLGPGDVTAMRPALGISPAVPVVGRRLAGDVSAGAPIHSTDLEFQ